jgi:hypothetical protein
MDKDPKSMNMIKLCIYFHTSGGGIALTPKVAFKSGMVIMPTNHKHGIRASTVGRIPFGQSQLTLNEAIVECLKQNGVKFLPEEKKTEYKKFQQMNSEGFYEDLKL